MKKIFRWRKLFAGCAAILMLLSVAGCGGGDRNEGSNGGTNKGKTDISLPSLDIKNDKVKYLTWDDASELTNPSSGFYEINELMKEKYNCELEFVYSNYADLATKLVTGVLSNNAPDLVKFKLQDFPNNIYKDLVQDMDDLIDWDSDLWKDIKSINDSYVVGGKHYAIVTDSYAGGVVFYNKEMFEENGVETPLELYQSDNWTWSKLEEIAKTMTQDNDKDGIVDIYGWVVHPLYFYPTCGVDFVKMDESGRFTNNMRDTSLSKAMEFILNTGMMGSDCRLLSLEGETAFKNNQVAMYWDQYWRIGTYAEKIKSGQIGFVPSPKMDGADKYYAASGGETTWVAKNASNKEGAAAYLNICRYIDTDASTVARLRQKTMDAYGFDEEQMKQLDEFKSDKFTLVSTNSMGVGEWGNTAMWELWNEIGVYETPWSTVCEKYVPILDSEIETANLSLQQ